MTESALPEPTAPDAEAGGKLRRAGAAATLRRRPTALEPPVRALVRAPRPAPAAVARPARPARSPGDVLLEAEGIEVAFGGVRANAGISIAVRHAAVTGLIGPNGAGKTTLFNVVSGAIRPDAGRIRLDGDDVTGAAPQDLVGRGCARTFQELALLDDLSVLDNVVFGAQHRWPHRLTPTVLRLRRRSESELVELARRALHLVGLAGEAGRPVSGLPYGLRRRVEIARALAAGPRLLLLDEPSSGMDPVETAELAELVNHIVDRLGVAVFLVEHDMNMVRLTADWLYVLDAGRLLCAGPPAEVLADPRVATAYLGTGR